MGLQWKRITKSKLGTTDEDIYASIIRGRKEPKWLWQVGPRAGLPDNAWGRAATEQEAKERCEEAAAAYRVTTKGAK